MAILRPTTEVSNIGWTLNGGANYATILGDESDSTYVSENSATGADLTVALASGTDPGVDTGFTIYAKARRTGTDASLNVSLLQGGTNIKTGTVTTGASFSDLSVALSAGEASAITDFTTLRIRLSGGGGDISGETWVSDVWLELPDAPTPTLATDGVTGFMQARPTMPGEAQYRAGETFTTTGVMKGDTPISTEDALGGQICQASGLWFPARRIVWVDGLPYADSYAFEAQSHPSYYPLPRKNAP